MKNSITITDKSEELLQRAYYLLDLSDHLLPESVLDTVLELVADVEEQMLICTRTIQPIPPHASEAALVAVRLIHAYRLRFSQ